MKKFVFFSVALLALGGVVFGSYSYSVSGKVYYAVGGLPVSGATVTHTVNFSGGGVASGNTMTANDGSFSFNVTSEALDYKGATMSLKATKNFCAGNTTWVCSSYSETKDVWISCNAVINPNLTVRVNPATFANPGIQLPSTTVAFLDAGSSVQITGFKTKISYDPLKIQYSSVAPAPPFIIDSVVPGTGTITVYGHSPTPVLLMVGVPDSFFDVFFEVPLTETPSFTSVLLEETTELYPFPSGPALHPYPHRTENLIGTPEKCQPGLLVDSEEEWQEALDGQRPGRNIRPTSITRWEQYMTYWHSSSGTEKQGLPYPATTFVPCVDLDGTGDPDGMLYAWGGGGGSLEDAGLVMAWKYDPTVLEGNYASAWEWDYGMDPDLTNCTIQVTVTPPAPPADSNSLINAVSFSIIDVTGKLRTWWWSVPAAIPLGVPTTVKINTAIAGIGAATPAATGYLNVLGFDITKSQFFDVDENFNYVFGQLPVPPPGQGLPPIWGWNYWHNLTVTKNTNAYKGTWVKYSQPPVVIDANDPPKINGWDEKSAYLPDLHLLLADDWPCSDDRPVTDIHWWGSFLGWTQPYLPPVLPKGFHIGIWTDVAKNDPLNQFPFSHPGKLIWEYRGTCTSWVWNFAGYDVDPRPQPPYENEACFQFNQLLSEDEYFAQDPNENDVYWLSIAAIYNAGDEQLPGFHPWGWKTRPHTFNDDAVRITGTADGLWPPKPGSVFGYGVPVQIPEYPATEPFESWDMAFELTTNERPPCHTLDADLNHDCVVDIVDFAAFAAQWLETSS